MVPLRWKTNDQQALGFLAPVALCCLLSAMGTRKTRSESAHIFDGVLAMKNDFATHSAVLSLPPALQTHVSCVEMPRATLSFFCIGKHYAGLQTTALAFKITRFF